MKKIIYMYSNIPLTFRYFRYIYFVNILFINQ